MGWYKLLGEYFSGMFLMVFCVFSAWKIMKENREECITYKQMKLFQSWVQSCLLRKIGNTKLFVKENREKNNKKSLSVQEALCFPRPQFWNSSPRPSPWFPTLRFFLHTTHSHSFPTARLAVGRCTTTPSPYILQSP